MKPFNVKPPFGGNLLPTGATGGQIQFNPNGQQHISIYTNGAHVSYDIRGNLVSGVHGTIHGGGQNIIVIPKVIPKP
jgi:hypothetical protein